MVFKANVDTGELSVCEAFRFDTILDLCARSRRPAEVWPVHEASCYVAVGCCFRQLRLIRSCIKSLPLGAAKVAVAASVTFTGTAAIASAHRRACVPPGRTPVGVWCRGEAHNAATGGSMITSRRSSVMFSTRCKSHSASSTSSIYSFFTELLQSRPACAIAALGLIPPRPGYGPTATITGEDWSPRAEDEDSFRRSCFLCRRSSLLEQSPACYSFGWLSGQKPCFKLTCSLRLTTIGLVSCLWGALVAVWPRCCAI